MIFKSGRILTKTQLKQMGQRIKKHILSGGYHSVENFALSNNLSKQTLYHIVNGERDPRISTLKNISDKLKISVSELINF